MSSGYENIAIAEIEWDALDASVLEHIAATDERDGAKERATKELEKRRQPANADISEYDPRADPGGERYEDQFATEIEDAAELTAEEVPLEDSRRDETTVLATDRFDSEGNRVEY